MSLITTIRRRQSIVRGLSRKGYRDAYVGQHIKRGLATQIRSMREDRDWTQADLAARLNTKQPAIARLEDEDYGQYSLQTLANVASAFDVALMVRFVPFSELVRHTTNLTSDHFAPVEFERDAALYVSEFPSATATTMPESSKGRVFKSSSSQLPLDWPGASVTAIASVRTATVNVDSYRHLPQEQTLQAAGGYR